MSDKFLYILISYMSGSVLFARLFGYLFKCTDIAEKSSDHNPGTANAFIYGGFWCGMFTLLGDVLKGFVPVFLYVRTFDNAFESAMIIFVMSAPVIGHVFPLFNHFEGGKGIAVTFGSLLGLFPEWKPFAVLALIFIFFSVVCRITPHYHRTIITYVFSMILIPKIIKKSCITAGFAVIAFTVLIKMWRSEEEKEKLQVKLLWMH